MNKTIWMAAILVVTLAMGSCKSSVKSNDSAEISLDSTSVAELQFREDINQETFKTILQQLGLKVEECDLSLVSARVMTENKKLTAWVIPKKVGESGEENSDSFTLDGYILLVDTDTGKIRYKYHKPAWKSSSNLLSIHIDSINTCMSDRNLTFGISSHYDESANEVRPEMDSFRELFVLQDDKLLPVMAFNTYKYRGENDGNAGGDGRSEEYTTELVASTHQTNGLNDVALITDGVWITSKDGNDDRKYSICDSIRAFSFTGNKYQPVSRGYTGVFHLQRTGESDNNYWFYYGRSLEQVYETLLPKAKYLKKELPKENCKYETFGEEYGYTNLTVEYKYEDHNILSIHMEFDEGSITLSITERENYTQLFKQMAD